MLSGGGDSTGDRDTRWSLTSRLSLGSLVLTIEDCSRPLDFEVL